MENFVNLPLGSFKWVKKTSQFNEDFIKRYNEDSNIGYFIEIDVQYPKELLGRHNGFPFLHEIMKTEKVKWLVANSHEKKKYVIFIKSLKETVNHLISFEKNA